MEMNRPTLIATVVLVFVVGLVFGSFSGLTNVASGQATRSSVTTAYVQTLESNGFPGGYVSGRAVPGANGAERYVYIYSVGDLGQLQVRKEVCQNCFCAHGNVCYDAETFRWQVPSAYSPGRYAFVITDAETKEKVYSTFTVAYEEPK